MATQTLTYASQLTDVNIASGSSGGGGGGGGGGSVTQGTVPWVVTTTGSILVTTTNPGGTETGGVNVYTSGPQAVSGSVALTNWPALMGVSGTVSAIIVNQPATVGVTGSVALTNWPLTMNVSSSAGIAVTVSATGSSGLLVTGSVTVDNFSQGVAYLPSSNTAIATAPPTDLLNDLPWTLSLTGSLSASNGQILPLKSDYQGNLANREQYAPVAEDNVNGVYAVGQLPLAVSTYCTLFTGSTGNIVASVVKAAPGVVYQAFVDNSAYDAVWVQLFNSTSSLGATAPSIYPIFSQRVPATGSLTVNLGPWGIYFSQGIGFALSLTSSQYSAVPQGTSNWGLQYK
jgi:hypothetical protein